MYVSYNKASKHMKQKVIEIKDIIEKSTVNLVDFSQELTTLLYRKKVSTGRAKHYHQTIGYN
jgi:hypothetical protein